MDFTDLYKEGFPNDPTFRKLATFELIAPLAFQEQYIAIRKQAEEKYGVNIVAERVKKAIEYRKSGFPSVVAMAAVSADWKINAYPDEKRPLWTPPEDMGLFTKITKEFGVVVFGGRTWDTIPKSIWDENPRTVFVLRRSGVYIRDPKQKEVKFDNDHQNFVRRSAGFHKFLRENGLPLVVVAGGNSPYKMSNGRRDASLITKCPYTFPSGLMCELHERNATEYLLSREMSYKNGQEATLTLTLENRGIE